MLDYFEFYHSFKISLDKTIRTKWKNLLEAIIKEKVNSLWLKKTQTSYQILVNRLIMYFEEIFFCSWVKIIFDNCAFRSEKIKCGQGKLINC